MPVDFGTTRSSIQKVLYEMGNENLVVQELYSPPHATKTFIIKCQACGEITKWESVYDPGPVSLSFFEEMCKNHKHEVIEHKVIADDPTGAGELPEEFFGKSLIKVPQEPYLTASKIKEATDKLIGMIGMMGDITFHGSLSRRVSVSQELLKWIAKLSNFNVDLQAFVQFGTNSDYRAICNQCKQFIKLPYECLINNESYDNSSQLGTFCKAHRHDGSELTPVPEGRKFRV